MQLRRRTDLIPNLVDTVKAYAAHERGLFEDIVRKRASSIAADNVPGQAAAERELQGSLARLIALAEAYPDLKADKNFLKLQEQLAEIEDQLQMARRYYNGTVRDLNIAIQSFPEYAGVASARVQGGAVLRARGPRRRGRAATSPSREAEAMLLRKAALALLAAADAARPASSRRSAFCSSSATCRCERNGDLIVTETIRVQAEGREIRRGILRDFPTTYRRPDGTRVVVGFEVRSVTRDGAAENYVTERLSNGVRIRIGSADRLLNRGPHEYVITYRTTRQIGFFPDYDELYWNATGTGWTFAIDEAEARITLPAGVPFRQTAFYTGPQDARGQGRDASSSSSPDVSCSAPPGRCRRATGSPSRPPGTRA